MAKGEYVSELLTVEQASKRLGVSDRWVYSAVEKCLIEHVRIGTHIRFRREVIEAYIEDHTRTAA